VHAAGDATGAELTRALATTVRRLPNVEIVERVLALDLVLEGSRVAGVVAVDAAGRRIVWSAADVVLATGGAGQVYRHTTNPAEGTGDGLAMAARAGARLAGLEFVQFHPTAMAVGGNPMPLLTEALRGEGAPLVDETGHRFMADVHRLAELAPRDVVARAIWRRRRDGHEVFLDTTVLADRFEARFPTVLELCLARGLDPRLRPVPAAPAAHYHMGGVVTDRQGRASIAGLWACGEVSHTGLHGANRLASNSLLEALVFGARIGRALSAAAQRSLQRTGDVAALPPVADLPWLAAGGGQAEIADRLRDIMWEGVGLERTAAGMQRALWDLNQVAQAAPPGLGELRNLLTVAMLVTRAAQARTESRGAHFRGDIPWQDPHWRQDLVFEGLELMDPHPVAAAG
jgi:L-aspartate oxidase